MKHPQEIEVWYVLPTIRRELAKELIKKHGFTQKKVAALLGVTEAAVSQYIKGKRAGDIKFESKINDEVKASAKKIAENLSSVFVEIQKICDKVRETKSLCKIHMQYDDVPDDCKECMC